MVLYFLSITYITSQDNLQTLETDGNGRSDVIVLSKSYHFLFYIIVNYLKEKKIINKLKKKQTCVYTKQMK